MKSVRVSQALQQRLAAKAKTLGASESEVIRMALDEFCDPTSERRAPVDEMLVLIEQWEREDATKPEIDAAQHSSKLFGDLLYEDWSKNQEVRQVAEERARYQTPAAD